MKKSILIFILSVISLTGYAQGQYYTMTQCGNDTLKYIEKNYEYNKTKYIGKTIAFWADETQLKLGEVIAGAFSPWSNDKSLIGKVESISFEFVYTEEANEISYYITFLLEAPYILDWEQAVDLKGDVHEEWGPKFYNYYKDQKIKEIYLLKTKNNRPLKDYTRP